MGSLDGGRRESAMKVIDDEAVRMMRAETRSRPAGKFGWARFAADMAVAVALLAATLAAIAWIHRTASRIERECRIHEERRMAERAVHCAAGALLVLGSHPTTPQGRARLAVLARTVEREARDLAAAAAKGGEA